MYYCGDTTVTSLILRSNLLSINHHIVVTLVIFDSHSLYSQLPLTLFVIYLFILFNK